MEEEAGRIIDSLAVPYQQIGARWPKEIRFSRIVNGALISAVLGLGYLILFSSSVYKSPQLFAVITWIAISLAIFAVFQRKYNKIALLPEERVFIVAYELITQLRQYPLPGDIS